MIKDRVNQLLQERQRGFSLPGAFYVDDDMFEADLEAVFATDWLFAGSVAEIRGPGDYITMEIGRDSIVILRDREGEVRAFFNTCRHRGSRLCLHETGRANRIVCPYHQWVYELDGSLINARQMPEGFDRASHGLHPVHVEVICGLIYVCLAETPPSLEKFRKTVTPYIAPHQPDRTKVAFFSTIIEEANWKLVIDNNRECYHCAGNHPALLVTLVEFALPDDPAANATFKGLMDRSTARWDGLGLPHAPADGGTEFRCIRLPFNDDCLSFTMDGKPACNKLLADFTEPDLGSVRMFRVPNNWNHFLSDHILHFRVLPLSANRTAVKTTWLVHEDAVEGVDYDLKRLTEVWTETNDEDRILAENNHKGVRSRAYQPGPLAPSEFMLNNFADWYCTKMADWAGGPGGRRIAAE
ncbi:aromatic ring-hydroxylating dioxygenase subunit alpha [Frigidibacter sp. MR17.14]|uniref:aromatic ring-hydroxylating oxygenase subunit alpha n=1 Tax=Frigidibacter sp. MR17.14 TaxID=3126509 RepID=UPI0030131331